MVETGPATPRDMKGRGGGAGGTVAGPPQARRLRGLSPKFSPQIEDESRNVTCFAFGTLLLYLGDSKDGEDWLKGGGGGCTHHAGSELSGCPGVFLFR